MSKMLTVSVVILFTLVFQGVIFGQEISERVFPDFVEPRSGVLGALDAVVAVAQAIWGGVLFFIALIGFDIPGTPWWLRVPMIAYNSFPIIYGISLLIRGGGNAN